MHINITNSQLFYKQKRLTISVLSKTALTHKPRCCFNRDKKVTSKIKRFSMALTKKQVDILKAKVASKATEKANKPSKYGNKRVTIDGFNFHSKAEAEYYIKLKALRNLGRLYFLMQCPLHLPGNVKYIVDFIVFHENGSVEYIDVKGVETDTFKLKRKQVEALHPIKITIVKA